MAKIKKLSVVVTVDNNADTLAKVVGDIRYLLGRRRQRYEIIIIDDASTDQSETVGRELASRGRNIKYHRLSAASGYGAALKTGMGLADGDWLFYTNGGGHFNMRELTSLLRANDDCQLVMGCRKWGDLPNQVGDLSRVSKLLYRQAFGLTISDPGSCFKLISKEVIDELSLLSYGPSIDYELLIRAIRAGFRYREVPVAVREKPELQSVMTTIGIIRRLWRFYPRVGKIYPRHRVKKIGRIRKYLYRWWRKLIDRPLEASLDISGRCDLQCISCTVWENKPPKEMPASFWIGHLDDLRRMGVRRVVLIGAEPLLRDDIGRIVRAVKSRGMGVTVFTNGVRLRVRAEELVESGMDRLVCSLDGPEAYIHDGVRGVGGVYQAVLDGIQAIKEAAASSHVPAPELVIHTTVSVANFHGVPDMPKLARSLQARLTIQSVCQVPKKAVMGSRYRRHVAGSRQYMIGDINLLLSKEDVASLKSRMRRIMVGYKNLSAKVFLALQDQHLINGTVPVVPCGHVRHTISVDPGGKVYPCAMLGNYPLGSLADKSVWTVWFGDDRKEFLKKLKSKPFPVCKHCCHYLNNLTFWQAFKVLIGLRL
jgi:radical SAM protein with 4Fe4S-binding SPASM domain